MSIITKEIYQCNNEAFGGDGLGQERLERLESLKVGVVGADNLGQMVLSSLYGLGVGNIHLIDNAERIGKDDKGFLYTNNSKSTGRYRSSGVKHELEKIDPTKNLQTLHGRFSEAFMYPFSPDIIIDTTNDVATKEKVIDYALNSGKKSIPFISLSSDETRSVLSAYYPKNKDKIKVFREEPNLESLVHEEFKDEPQGGYTSGVVSGLATEEVRKFVFSYGDDDKPLKSNQRIFYNTYSDKRTSLEDDLMKNNMAMYRDKKILVVGAGALGNWVEIYLSQLGLKQVDFADFDKVEEKNLNRQIELRGRVGEYKSTVLSEMIKKHDKHVKSTGFNGKICYGLDELDKSQGVSQIPPDFILDRGYDAILGCVDNKYARIWMDDFCVKNKIPYIDGGTNVQQGQMAVYYPDKTDTINKQLKLQSLPETRRHSCIDRPNPSVVMSNEIVAGLMVGELVHVLNRGDSQNPTTYPLAYDTNFPGRIYCLKRKKR